MREWRFIILHHSLTKDSGTVSWDAIRHYHKHVRKWDDIGYHFGVELVGETYQYMLGRHVRENGAHTKALGMNSLGLGVCLVGNFDVAPVPIDQWNKALWLCKWLCDGFDIEEHNVLGHREVGAMIGKDWKAGEFKSCPGKNFNLNRFRTDLLMLYRYGHPPTLAEESPPARTPQSDLQ